MSSEIREALLSPDSQRQHLVVQPLEIERSEMRIKRRRRKQSTTRCCCPYSNSTSCKSSCCSCIPSGSSRRRRRIPLILRPILLLVSLLRVLSQHQPVANAFVYYHSSSDSSGQIFSILSSAAETLDYRIVTPSLSNRPNHRLSLYATRSEDNEDEPSNNSTHKNHELKKNNDNDDDTLQTSVPSLTELRYQQ